MNTPINDGGPAFPEVVTKNDRYDQSAYVASGGGMTLRDYFAGQALAGMLADTACNGLPKTMAYNAYDLADAMLAAWEAKQ